MITWICDVCGEERPDDKITVYKTDLSAKYGLPEGTVTHNAKFCKYNVECMKLAPKVYAKNGF